MALLGRSRHSVEILAWNDFIALTVIPLQAIGRRRCRPGLVTISRIVGSLPLESRLGLGPTRSTDVRCVSRDLSGLDRIPLLGPTIKRQVASGLWHLAPRDGSCPVDSGLLAYTRHGLELEMRSS